MMLPTRFFALLAETTDPWNRVARALGRMEFHDTVIGALPARVFPGRGPHGVAFCPAWLVDHRLYTRFCAALARRGPTVVAFDFLGEGRAPGTTRLSVDTFLDGTIFHHRTNAENARAALDYLEDELRVEGHLALAGHSRGGYQAATVPDRRIAARVSIQPFNWIVPPAGWFALDRLGVAPNRMHPRTLLFSGDLDLGLAPPLLNQLPMYRSAPSPKMWVSILGAEHLLSISDLPSVPHWTPSILLHSTDLWLRHTLDDDREVGEALCEHRAGVSYMDWQLNGNGKGRNILGLRLQ